MEIHIRSVLAILQLQIHICIVLAIFQILLHSKLFRLVRLGASKIPDHTALGDVQTKNPTPDQTAIRYTAEFSATFLLHQLPSELFRSDCVWSQQDSGDMETPQLNTEMDQKFEETDHKYGETDQF